MANAVITPESSMTVQTREAPSKPSPDWSALPLEVRHRVYKHVFGKSVLNIERSGDVAGDLYKRFITRKLNCRLVFGTYDDEMIAPLITWRVKTPDRLLEWLSQRLEYRDLIYKLIIHSGTSREEGPQHLHVSGRGLRFYTFSSWFDDQNLALKWILPRLKRLSFEIHKSQIVAELPEGEIPNTKYETLLEWMKDIEFINPGVQVRIRHDSKAVVGGIES